MSLITALGLRTLKEKLSQLEAELVRTFDERSAAAAEGDLKENSLYIFMGERANVLHTQISEIKLFIKEAEVASPPTQTAFIEFGHRVKILFVNDNRPMDIVLVGRHDSRLRPDWISLDSPLGEALSRQTRNTVVQVNGQPVKILDILIEDISD